MRINSIKELFLEEIVPTMEHHSFHFLKSKNAFVFENAEWRNECILRFSEFEKGKIFLRTEYFITSKKISHLFQQATLELDSLPTCGASDIIWVYDYLDISLDSEPWFDLDAASIDSVVRRWTVEFESIGLVFFREMNNYENLETLFDIFHVSKCSPLCIWTGERALNGICLHYIMTRNKQKTLEIFSLYKQEISWITLPSIKNQFELLEKYIKKLPEVK